MALAGEVGAQKRTAADFTEFGGYGLLLLPQTFYLLIELRQTF